jgi:hypothetical protein
MALPTAEEVTNKYLYGKETTPDDLVDEALIRPEEPVEYRVNINEYIAGPGRFVTPGAFTIVERFFDPWFYADSAALEQKEADADGRIRYTKEELYAAFAIPEKDSRRWVSLQQWAYDDGRDDWMERAYIWNTTAFKIIDEARFVIEPDGNRYVENYGIREYVNAENLENFDLVGGDFAAKFFNDNCGPQIDPSKIGCRVNFVFNGTPASRT